MSAAPPPASRNAVWVTRPAEDAADLAQALAERGWQPLVQPLLEIEFLDGPPLDLAGVQALLATSANGVRAFVRRSAERALPVLAVGDATARTARAAGFVDVRSAAGDVAALAELAVRELEPSHGTLLHIAAGEVAGDLAGTLSALGFELRRAVLYRARPAERLAPVVAAALEAGRLAGVVVYSPRTARTLVRLLRHAGLAPAAARLGCWCLSPAVAEAAGEVRWKALCVAERPTQAALLAAIGDPPAGSQGIAANSLSSTGHFAGSLAPEDGKSRSRERGMSSDDKPGRPLDDTAAPGREATPVASTPVSSPEGGTIAAGAGAADQARDPAPMAEVPGVTSSDAAGGRADETAGDRRGGSDWTAPEAPTAATARSFPWGPVLAGLLLLAVLGAGAAAWHYGWMGLGRPQVAAVEPVDRATEVDAALDDLDGRLAALRQQIDAMAPRLEALERSTASVRQTVDQLATESGKAEDETIKAIDDRLGRLEGQAAQASGLVQQVRSLEATTAAARDTASKLATTVLAVGQLAQAVDDGSGFVRELAAVRAMGGDDADIAQAAATLEPLAADGVPTLADLRAKFPPVADAVARAEPVSGGTGWTDRVVDQLASLVSVRRVGPNAVAAGGADGALARAEAALGEGDLQGAVAAVRQIEGPASKPAQEWLALATARVDAERALATLQQRALARLSATRG